MSPGSIMGLACQLSSISREAHIKCNALVMGGCENDVSFSTIPHIAEALDKNVAEMGKLHVQLNKGPLYLSD